MLVVPDAWSDVLWVRLLRRTVAVKTAVVVRVWALCHVAAHRRAVDDAHRAPQAPAVVISGTTATARELWL